MTDGEKIAKAALTWIGTPHVDNAMAKGKGVDCAHLLIAACEESGLINPGEVDPGYYSNEWHLHRSEEMFLDSIKRYCRKVKTPKIGDFFMYRYGRTVSHGGIYIGNGQIVHSYVGMGVILSRCDDIIFNDPKGRSRLYGIYRLKTR